jgi:hypothetical protein
MNNNRLKKAKNALGVPWVLSGSMAMKLYGNKYRVQTRQPANVNIIVNKKNMANAYNALFILVPPGRIPPNTSNVKTKNHYNLHQYDLLKANSNLAPSIKSWVNLNGIPVVSLENLLTYKTKALHNLPPENKKKQIGENIQKLRELRELRDRKSPLTVKQRNSPRSPPKRLFMSSQGSPGSPRTPPKRLFMNSPRTPTTRRLFNSPQ